MNLDRFKATFAITADNAFQAPSPNVDFGVANLGQILNALGGKTFNHGLYRVLRTDQIHTATQAMEGVFPEYRGRIVPFAFDWLGRHFVIDRARVEKGQPLILMLEVGAGEAMEIPASVLDFHNVELVDYTNDALAATFWRQWRSENPIDLAFTDCVGYKVPLFLGGPDVLANLEVIVFGVYVETCGQLRNKVRTLAPGQSIRSVRFGH